MRRGMRVAFGLVLLLCILIGGGYAFMSQASFGKLPEGDRLDAISQSPHYEGGAFRNTEPLPPIKGNGGIVGALMKYSTPLKVPSWSKSSSGPCPPAFVPFHAAYPVGTGATVRVPVPEIWAIPITGSAEPGAP